jgi:hypothetical protein
MKRAALNAHVIARRGFRYPDAAIQSVAGLLIPATLIARYAPLGGACPHSTLLVCQFGIRVRRSSPTIMIRVPRIRRRGTDWIATSA